MSVSRLGQPTANICQRITVRRQHNGTIGKLSVWNSRPERLSSGSPNIGRYDSVVLTLVISNLHFAVSPHKSPVSHKKSLICSLHFTPLYPCPAFHLHPVFVTESSFNQLFTIFQKHLCACILLTDTVYISDHRHWSHPLCAVVLMYLLWLFAVPC